MIPIKERLIRDIQRLEEAIHCYKVAFEHFGSPDYDTYINTMHKVIGCFDIEKNVDTLQYFNVNQYDIIGKVRHLKNSAEDLSHHITADLEFMEKIDPKVADVFKFCDSLTNVLEISLNKLELRKQTDPTRGDVAARKSLDLLVDDGGGDFCTFLNKHIFYNVEGIDRDRRLNYLIDNCTDEEIKERLKDYREQWRQTDTPEPQQTPSVQTVKDETHLPDFSQMRSYEMKITFDIPKLYYFLIDCGVIENIDKQLFSDCITHAYINPLWEECGRLRKRNQLRCVIHVLYQKYSSDWIENVASKLGTIKKRIYNPNRNDSLKNFEKKLHYIL